MFYMYMPVLSCFGIHLVVINALYIYAHNKFTEKKWYHHHA